MHTMNYLEWYLGQMVYKCGDPSLNDKREIQPRAQSTRVQTRQTEMYISINRVKRLETIRGEICSYTYPDIYIYIIHIMYILIDNVMQSMYNLLHKCQHR